MPRVTVVYWRDIPAQVIVGAGRRAAKRVLAERFEQAIDRCAMQVGARETDAYLAEWRRAKPYDADGAPGDVVLAEAAKLEESFDDERLKALIANSGWDRDNDRFGDHVGDHVGDRFGDRFGRP